MAGKGGGGSGGGGREGERGKIPHRAGVVFGATYSEHGAESAAAAYKAIEVDDAMLAHVEGGGRLVIKASGGDAVVAVTQDATYAVTLVESSNALLVGGWPAAGGEWELTGRVGGYLELKRTAPPLARLHDLLRAAQWDGTRDLVRPRGAPPPPPPPPPPAAAGGGGGGGGGDGDSGGRAAAAAADDDATQAVEDDAGRDGEEGGGGVGVTWEALADAVPCSDAELAAGLRDAGALELEPGWWVSLTPAYYAAVLDTVIRKAAACGARLSAVPSADLAADLVHHHLPPAVVAHVLASVSDAASEATACVSFNKLARAVGLHVLARMAGAARTAAAALAAAASGAAPLPTPPPPPSPSAAGAPSLLVLAGDPTAAVPAAAFLAEWRAALPPEYVAGVSPPPLPPLLTLKPVAVAADGGNGNGAGGTLCLDLLRGGAILEVTPGGVVAVRLLPAGELSPDPLSRFRQLFAVRPRWTLADLTPFVEPLVGFGRTRDDLLLAHSRSTLQPDGSRLFSAR